MGFIKKKLEYKPTVKHSHDMQEKSRVVKDGKIWVVKVCTGCDRKEGPTAI